MRKINKKSGIAAGFSLPEVMFATAASTIVMGALVISSISLQKSFNATEKFSVANSAQNRLIDYVAMDLRRAVKVSASNTPSTPFRYDPVTPANNIVTIAEANASHGLNYLTITQPGFYTSNTPNNANYAVLNTLISVSGNTIRYGSAVNGATPAAVTPDTVITYQRKIIDGVESFTRTEAGVEEIIVQSASSIDLDINIESDNHTFVVETWFLPEYSNANTAHVTSSDRVMLRNGRTD